MTFLLMFNSPINVFAALHSPGVSLLPLRISHLKQSSNLLRKQSVDIDHIINSVYWNTLVYCGRVLSLTMHECDMAALHMCQSRSADSVSEDNYLSPLPCSGPQLKLLVSGKTVHRIIRVLIFSPNPFRT